MDHFRTPIRKWLYTMAVLASFLIVQAFSISDAYERFRVDFLADGDISVLQEFSNRQEDMQLSVSFKLSSLQKAHIRQNAFSKFTVLMASTEHAPVFRFARLCLWGLSVGAGSSSYQSSYTVFLN